MKVKTKKRLRILSIAAAGVLLISAGNAIQKFEGDPFTMEPMPTEQTIIQETQPTEKPQVVEQKININTADTELLCTLNGVGEKTAEAIINYRMEHGNFGVIEDLMNVRGIGEKTFAKIKDAICVE